jgi:hypothetical protein
MAFREVTVVQIREALRLCLRGEGLSSVERLAGIDRKTGRRHVEAALDTGLARNGGEDQLNDVFLSLVVEKVRPTALTATGVVAPARRAAGEDPSLDRRRRPDGGEGPHPFGSPGDLGAHPDPGALLCRAVRAPSGPQHGPGGRRRAGRRASDRLRAHGAALRRRDRTPPG